MSIYAVHHYVCIPDVSTSKIRSKSHHPFLLWWLSLAKCWISLHVTSTIPSKQNTCLTISLHLSMLYHLGNLRGYPNMLIQGLHLGPMVGIIHHHLETIKAHALELFSARHVRRIGLVQRWGDRVMTGDWCHIDVWCGVKQIMLIHNLSAVNRMLTLTSLKKKTWYYSIIRTVTLCN